MNKLLVILGLTSTGKTDLALHLAKKFNGELVSCDSRQIYKGLDIGTGKMPGSDLRFKIYDLRILKGKGWWKIDGVKIWMYDVADPKKQYTVYDYVKDANQVIDSIIARKKLPIIVGGTGLYLKALLEDLPNLGIPVNEKLRKELSELSLDQLQKKLQKLSPQKWKKMNSSDRHNPRRLVRYIELASVPYKREILLLHQMVRDRNDKRNTRNDILKIGLTVPRNILYQRIDERVISRISQGMIEEAKSLQKNGLTFKRIRQLGLEYGVLADYLEGKITSEEDELIKIMQGKIHDYARRQLTWFRKEENVLWFDIIKIGWLDRLERQVNSWYYATYDEKN